MSGVGLASVATLSVLASALLKRNMSALGH
jgi:hypothetical protein